MARAQTKKQLLEFGEEEFAKLIDLAKQYKEKGFLKEKIFDNRIVKDILAHIHAWHELAFVWYEEGMNDGQPEIPAPGYTFKDAPALNEKLYQDFKDTSWDEIVKKLKKSHKKLMKIIGGHSEEELFTKKKYKWTGSTSMGSYFASAASSHYVWGSELLRKKLKKLEK
ncbi:ClbS/DfsB family four-helix bundle protein [Candidatus Dojkabacteria bacterium]|nr:ClbS/DfsB family four-helix bundle protein [Candidatus Dojkabacteria bacterium]